MVDDVVTRRLHRRVRLDFQGPDTARGVVGALRALVEELGESGMRGTSAERLLTAVVIEARGDVRGVRRAVRLALTDWRDLLVAADLAHPYWPARLDEELGGP